MPGPIAASSLLVPGMRFTGHQRLNQSVRRFEDWTVHVEIQSVNFEQGHLCGSMTAENIPSTDASVVTFWEGQIIDNRNHTFYTNNWSASPTIDIGHWKQFASFKESLLQHAERGLNSIDLSDHSHIYLRLKEQFFINSSPVDSGLTIAGFYYACLDRATGTIEGYYFDPDSTPWQQLLLQHPLRREKRCCLGTYDFA